MLVMLYMAKTVFTHSVIAVESEPIWMKFGIVRAKCGGRFWA